VANLDWRKVYREEKRHPGYVLENGRSPVISNRKPAARMEVKPSVSDKRKAA
jgi:hypothetical protein